MIDQATIQRIKDAAHIEEVVGEFVSLKKRGTNHIGCCPFHQEKTPSFYVSPAKGIYKCFGCGKSGDTVRFLMEHEHYTYPEALRWLASKYNIQIEEEKLTQEQVERNNERDGLFHVSEFAQKHFASLLYEDEMGRAVGLAYLHNRGISDKAIKDFGLGYCLDEWDAFTKYARENGYSDNVLEKTGLTIFKENGKSYDRFRGRVMFPIYSISGRVLGFSGRVLSKEKTAAKYVNSPDSEIYDKSHTLYGLYQAKQAIAKADKCYLVEGNADVVSMHQSGVENTVASCGTSLTSEQIRLIKRYTPNVTVLYDGDSAGIKATIRAVNLLFEEGMHVRVALFPDGEDPDSYAQKYGSTKLQEFLAENEQNFILYRARQLADEVKNDPIRKVEVLHEIVQTIALVPDMMERSEYVTHCSTLLGMPEHTLQAELTKCMNAARRKAFEKQQAENNDAAAAAMAQEMAAAEAEAAEAGVPAAQPDPIAQVQRVLADSPVERHLIKLLIDHGYETIAQPAEEGSTDEELYPVAGVIVGDLLSDNIGFDNPVYQKIFDTYVVWMGEEGEHSSSEFMDSDDEQLRDVVAGLMVEDYTISEQWAKKNVPVPDPKSRLRPDVEETLLAMRMRQTDRMIEENGRAMRTTRDEEALNILLGERQQLIRIKQQIGQKLRRVYS